jgi:hypothetical protein
LGYIAKGILRYIWYMYIYNICIYMHIEIHRCTVYMCIWICVYIYSWLIVECVVYLATIWWGRVVLIEIS